MYLNAGAENLQLPDPTDWICVKLTHHLAIKHDIGDQNNFEKQFPLQFPDAEP